MAPDYLLVHKEIKDLFVNKIQKRLSETLGENPELSPNFARIVSNKEFERLVPLLTETGKIAYGGKSNPETKFIEPTIIVDADLDSQLMSEEIFGPILPIIEYESDEEVIKFIENRPHPLALYIYTKDKSFKENILNNTNFGGAMINDSVLYYTHPEIPFGGKGESGMGNYSGKYSFETFSQQRPIIEAGTFIDRTLEKIKIKSFRYPPFKPRSSKLLKLFHRTFKRFRL
jgi:aldehyde dehydrogenase (NAD+)